MNSHIFTGPPVATRQYRTATTWTTLWMVICTIPTEPTAMIMVIWKLPTEDLRRELFREFAVAYLKCSAALVSHAGLWQSRSVSLCHFLYRGVDGWHPGRP